MPDFLVAPYLFDGLGELVAEGCVVVEDGLIVGAGRIDRDTIPSGSNVIRFDNGCLLPGFVDAHNHLGLDDDEEGNDEAQMADPEETILQRASKTAPADVRSGVTTLREQGERDYLDMQFRKAIESGDYLGPRLLTAGPWITATHGHGAWPLGADIADGPDEVRRAVRRHLKAGVDVVKIMISGGIADSGQLGASYYTAAEVRVAVEEAHNLGVRVSAHCYGGPGARMAVEAGVDTLEHAARLTDPRDLDVIAKQGTYLVYTAGVIHDDARIQDSAALALQRALAAGVKIGLGADTAHGRFGYEAECAVEYGASSVQALAAMTSGSAGACGLLDTVGSLQVGKVADVVVVGGNPVDTISSVRDVQFVMKRGVVLLDRRPAMV
jgi:imidazolonepropionase-like amidohydrolase